MSGDYDPATGLRGGEGFHSISFPSEWGVVSRLNIPVIDGVSIQLVSPASGENLI